MEGMSLLRAEKIMQISWTFWFSIHEDEAKRRKEVIGAMSYVAPEVLDGKPYAQVFVMTSFCVHCHAHLHYSNTILQYCSSESRYLCIWPHNVDV